MGSIYDVKAVRAVERLPKRSYIGQILYGLSSLWKGMKLTLYYLLHPSTVVTQQYPENRDTLKLYERTRHQLKFVHDENGYHKCTSCKACENICPNASIIIHDREKPAVSRVELEHFLWRLDTCTFCNLCVMVCPFSVLEMAPNFETAVYDPRLLTYNLNKHSGPTGTVLLKNPVAEERAKLIGWEEVYGGPTPIRGEYLPGLPGYVDDPNSRAEKKPLVPVTPAAAAPAAPPAPSTPPTGGSV